MARTVGMVRGVGVCTAGRLIAMIIGMIVMATVTLARAPITKRVVTVAPSGIAMIVSMFIAVCHRIVVCSRIGVRHVRM